MIEWIKNLFQKRKTKSSILEEHNDTENHLTQVSEMVEIEKEKDIDSISDLDDKIKIMLKWNLNNKIVYLVDFENISEFPKINDIKNAYIYVFVGKNQTKKYNDMFFREDYNDNITAVISDTIGKNYNDIVLGYYLGAIYSNYKPERIIILSGDKGFNSILDVAKKFNINNLYITSNSNNDYSIPKGKIYNMYKNLCSLYSLYSHDSDGKTIELSKFKKAINKMEIKEKSSMTKQAFQKDVIAQMQQYGYVSEIFEKNDIKYITIYLPKNIIKRRHNY